MPPRKRAASKTAKKTPAKKAPPKPKLDLNSVVPKGVRTDEQKAYWSTRTKSGTSGIVEVHTGDVTQAIVDFILASPSIVGAVAWLTSGPMLEAMSLVGDVTILVQKEADLQGKTAQSRAQLAKYRAIGNGVLKNALPEPISQARCGPRLGPVRSVGAIHGRSSRHTPRMHNKFLVRGHYRGRTWVPEAVLTGSSNGSINAGYSLENILIVHDPDVAAFYLDYFARMAAISEPMNSVHRTVQPEWVQQPPAKK
jgi:hypothetical protein